MMNFSRVAHLVAQRTALVDHLEVEFTVKFERSPWEQVVDKAMLEALRPVFRPIIDAELNRRIAVIDSELIELGMSID